MTHFSRLALSWALGTAILPAGHARAQVSEQVPEQTPPQETTVAGPLPARLSDVEGAVRMERLPATNSSGDQPSANPQAGSAFRHATANMPVLAGMQVETGSDGRGEIQFNDGSIARLTPNSALGVVSLENGGEQLRALRGLSYFETPDRAVSNTTVQVGPDQVRPESNSLLRLNLDNTPLQVAVLRGGAHLEDRNQGNGFSVNAGQTATLDPASASAYDVKGDVANESWDNWNADRDEELGQMAQGVTDAREAAGDTDSPAWNDLDYYGTWYDVPGTGMAWAPDGVDSNFDPYGSGAWGYYTGVGYTWVSAYPWGWLPYHSGHWRYCEGFGWVWQPGGASGAGWYPYTHLNHRPPGYNFPIPPSVPRPHTRLTGAPLPRSQPLVPISRGTTFRFRQVGGVRPEPRPLPLNGLASTRGGNPGVAPVLPVAPRPQGFRQPYDGGSAFTGNAGALQGSQPTWRGRSVVTAPGAIAQPPGVIAPGPNVITPSPRVLAPPRSAILPPPAHIVQPPAAHFSPPPAVHAAPPAAAAPRGH